MAFWITLRDQMLALWNRWTIAQRVGFSAAAAACVAAVAGTMIWASMPDYVVIASQLTPQRSASIAGVLDTEQIGYQLNFSGSAVSVASTNVARARLALRDELYPEEVVEPENSFLPFGSPRSEEDRRRGALEKRIGKTVAQIRGVRTATVQISRPDQTPFSIEQSPVTAAVVIEPKPGELLSSATAQTIISIVARSVPGLSRDNITLTDTNGRQFGSHDGIQSELGSQLEFRQQLETSLATNAEGVLASAQGVRAVVRVTADIDFSEQTKTSNTYDPDSRAKRSEIVVSSKQDGPKRLPVGIAGTATNVPADANAGKESMGKSSSEEVNVHYDTSFVNEQVRLLPGTIRRLTVAAIVDVQPSGGAGGNTNPAESALPLLQLEQIERIIKSAVGFDAQRNDEVQVVLAPLQPLDIDEPALPGFVWQQWQPLIQSVSLGLAATLTFLIGLMLMKRMKPIVFTETVGPGIPLADARRLASISEQAKAHPEIVASILSAWLNEQQQTAASLPSDSSGSDGLNASPSPGGSSASKSAIPPRGMSNEGRRAA